ncbi:tRNA (adenosine(37)-N6)-threonylcarbamoyltransferase complex ATPase subunit type 1 TsaE [Rhabdobacter roseus]|uniref:tRNA threonylcarbamoyladenosine biosynthesis protein TsaE n=1 Tax=Rhabdobacter roseus TaxID=1655419 RepID=A0A840U312_9BACT|nr:tRNA (adenosine(37)-N6)-threonylcarbamoyltransferase complex ATPase subunit type 1 TsaE [Rhabdobacter roseus]MBB5286510.1 tRNA threonylcarbamoyladenosine biosynthesis protein TsaE [Rhabdobacter roseus]
MKARSVSLRFRSLSDLDAVAAQLLELGAEVPVWLFEGPMGVGKTTLIQKLCAQLGVTSTVQSPTFALVNEYNTDQDAPIYHFDFYRLQHETEALDIGVEEYLDSGFFCFIEWPGRIRSLWPLAYFLINIVANEDGERMLNASVVTTY